MPLALGQGSGDFTETSGRIQLYHMGTRNSLGLAAPDAFTQANPSVVVTSANVSTQLAGITSVGILGATCAFTRPDAGNGFIGGAAQISSSYDAAVVPLGLFLNDAAGNAFENTPATASGRTPYVSGQGVVGVTLWETQQQIGGSTTLVYSVGDKLYASVNGLLTNRIEDAYEYNVGGQSDADFVTIMGVLKVVADANNSLMVLDMRV